MYRYRYFLSTVLFFVYFLFSTSPAFAEGLLVNKDNEIDKLMNMGIEELVVSVASKKEESVYEAPGTVSVLTQDDLKQYGAKDLHDALRLLPGVFPWGFQYLRNTNVAIRGQASTVGPDGSVLFLLNGRPLRDNWGAGLNNVIVRNISLDMLDHIEMIRGPGSVLYGTNAMNGVINIVTKTQPDEGANKESAFTAGYGSFDTLFGEASGGVKYNDFTAYVGARNRKTDGWRTRSGSPAGGSGVTDFSENNVGFTTTANYKNLTLNAFYGYTNDVVLNALPLFNPQSEVSKTHLSFVDGGYELRINDEWDLTTNLAFSSLDTRYINSMNITSENWFYENMLRGQLTDKLSLIGEFNLNYWSGDETVTNINYDLTHIGSFLQTEYQLTEKYKLVTGVQFNLPEGLMNGMHLLGLLLLVGSIITGVLNLCMDRHFVNLIRLSFI
ncbi:TonB-dependent receptor plug domain-containing protein [Rickettsiales bacterium]|nr:TonB-dependent receptor plug domain-containing protein [Rickettsiales bacterium]